MKTKFIFSLLTALLFNFATSGLFAQSIGIDHNLMFGIQLDSRDYREVLSGNLVRFRRA